jgi:hypothetical protein
MFTADAAKKVHYGLNKSEPGQQPKPKPLPEPVPPPKPETLPGQQSPVPLEQSLNPGQQPEQVPPELQSKVALLEQHIQTLEAQLHTRNTDVSQLEQTIGQLQTTLSTVSKDTSTKLLQLQASIDSLNKQLLSQSQGSAHIDPAIQAELKALSAQVAELEKTKMEESLSDEIIKEGLQLFFKNLGISISFTGANQGGGGGGILFILQKNASAIASAIESNQAQIDSFFDGIDPSTVGIIGSILSKVLLSSNHSNANAILNGAVQRVLQKGKAFNEQYIMTLIMYILNAMQGMMKRANPNMSIILPTLLTILKVVAKQQEEFKAIPVGGPDIQKWKTEFEDKIQKQLMQNMMTVLSAAYSLAHLKGNKAEAPSPPVMVSTPGATGMPFDFKIYNNINLEKFARSPAGQSALMDMSQSVPAPNNINPKFLEILTKIVQHMQRLSGKASFTSPSGNSGGGRQKGGNGDIVKKAKEIRGKLDDLKKSLRSITDGLSGIKDRYSKFENIFHTNGSTDKYDKISALKTQPANDTKSELERVKAEEKKALGMATAINDAGTKLVEETTKFINEKKEELRNVIKVMNEVFDDQPSNTTYIAKAQELKDLIEGSFDNDKKDSDTSVGVISRLDKVLNKVKSDFEEVNGRISSIASGIRETNKNEVEKNRVNYLPGYGKTSGGSSVPNIDTDFGGYVDAINNVINNRILSGILKPVDSDYIRRTNPIMSAALGAEPTLFATIYQNYLDNKAKFSQPVALDRLSESVEVNHLSPQEVLEINAMDKVVFVFIMLFMRLFSVSVVGTLISKNWIRKLSVALVAYTGFYSLFLLIFTIIVNADAYRMRIVFNYVNLHANAGRLISHIAIMWIFSFLFLMIIWHNAIQINGIYTSDLSSEIKADLMYRTEVLSMILWIFSFILVAIF